ncbi:MaoC family dehydratase [Halosimplex salinum]|uniref:MaoC family dehydratase n=1 Tax=Halosimplex salinum TaxID=1710538 RepID=UPI000F4A1B24|nr:MaoC family dehydratase [Halosimplex salinum]
MRYFEDIDVGETETVGDYEVTAAEIKEFASRYDPQPFHLDEESAADSVFGELVASGWHVGSICMRLNVDRLDDEAVLAGVGLDDLRWERPVTPGDTLRLRTEVTGKRPSESRDDRGYVTTRMEGRNQDDEVVISFDATALFARRPE